MSEQNTKLTEVEILNEILQKPETRKDLVKQLNFLADEKSKINRLNTTFKEDVKGTAEAFEIGVGIINKIVNALADDKVESELEKLNVLSDLFTVISEE